MPRPNVGIRGLEWQFQISFLELVPSPPNLPQRSSAVLDGTVRYCTVCVVPSLNFEVTTHVAQETALPGGAGEHDVCTTIHSPLWLFLCGRTTSVGVNKFDWLDSHTSFQSQPQDKTKEKCGEDADRLGVHAARKREREMQQPCQSFYFCSLQS